MMQLVLLLGAMALPICLIDSHFAPWNDKYIRQGDEGHTLKITSTTFCYFHLTSLVFFSQQKLVIYYLHTFVFHLLGLVINWTPDPHLIRTLREIEIKKRQVIDRYYVSERF